MFVIWCDFNNIMMIRTDLNLRICTFKRNKIIFSWFVVYMTLYNWIKNQSRPCKILFPSGLLRHQHLAACLSHSPVALPDLLPWAE